MRDWATIEKRAEKHATENEGSKDGRIDALTLLYRCCALQAEIFAAQTDNRQAHGLPHRTGYAGPKETPLPGY